jgi:hypothetical protein
MLRVPAKLFPEGDYEVTPKGVTANGNLEDLPEYYYFSLARR